MNIPFWIIAGCIVIVVAWQILNVVFDAYAAHERIKRREKCDEILKKHFDKKANPK